MEIPEVESDNEDICLASAHTPVDEEMEEPELEVEEQPLKRYRLGETESTAGSPSKTTTLEDDDDSGSSSPSPTEPMQVMPLRTAPPVGSDDASEFGAHLNLLDLVSEDEAR